jgi:hypothetical protein
VPHLAHRPRIYEFPNPFTAANWGFPGDQHRPEDIDAIRFVVVERPLLDNPKPPCSTSSAPSPDGAPAPIRLRRDLELVLAGGPGHESDLPQILPPPCTTRTHVLV